MKLATAFVPLRKVKPTASRWNFSETELETAAHLVLDVEGIVNPIVVRREEGTASYAVLDGNFEYYVAARAHQIDPRRCESIEAFIVESRDETTVQKQIALFRKPFAGSPKVLPPDLRYRLLTDEDSMALRFQSSPSLLSHQLLAVFNHAASSQVLSHLKRIGITGKNAEKVVEAIEHERQTKPFVSLKEVVARVKGLTYEKMVDLFEVE